MVKNPRTGMRISRPNDKNVWTLKEAPDLRIVPAELWEAVQARLERRSREPRDMARNRKHLLSGLLRCGSCGGGMSRNGKDRSGRVRIRCSSDTEGGVCPDPRTFYIDTIETIVLDRIRGELTKPCYITQFIDSYITARRELAREMTRNRSKFQDQLDKANAGIERIVEQIGDGVLTGDEAKPRLARLREEKGAAEMALAAQPAPIDAIVLHPTALRRYDEQLANLSKAVQDGVDAGDLAECDALRDIITSVVVHPDPAKKGGVILDIQGKLNALVGWESRDPRSVGSNGSGGGTRTPDTRIMMLMLVKSCVHFQWVKPTIFEPCDMPCHFTV